MKQLITILFLFLSLTIIAQPSQDIDWDAVYDRYIEKYQPEKIPSWVFPLIFENGLGERDTIYWAYAPNVSSTDPPNLYGTRFLEIDSSSFEAFWAECGTCDTLTVRDLFIRKQPFISFVDIRFRYGYYPVTMYYNSELMYK